VIAWLCVCLCAQAEPESRNSRATEVGGCWARAMQTLAPCKVQRVTIELLDLVFSMRFLSQTERDVTEAEFEIQFD
jgi:hypothetical protein